MQIKVKKGRKIDPKSKMPYKRRAYSEMIKIVNEIHSGLLSNRSACLKYGLCRNTLRLFITKQSIRTLGDKNSYKLFTTMSANQKDAALIKKIQELTKELEYAKLKIVGLETMIKVAEEDLNIKIRKKHGTKRLKE